MKPNVRFLLTNRCTACCAYCHNEGQETRGAPLLSVQRIDSILNKLAADGCEPEEIILSGGEPTLHKQVGHIARLCKESGAKVSMDSHGGHPQLLEAALPYIDELKLHIDSFDPEIQRVSMGIELAEVYRSINLAHSYSNLKLCINHPMRELSETISFVKISRELGADCKVIEMFNEINCDVLLNNLNMEEIGYTKQSDRTWIHEDGKHSVFHKNCSEISNRDNAAIFIGPGGVRRAVDGEIICMTEDFHAGLLY